VEVRLVQLLPRERRWPREVIRLVHELLQSACGGRLLPEYWKRIEARVRERAKILMQLSGWEALT